MDVLIYFTVLLAAAAALVSLSYLWFGALRDALHARTAAPAGRGAARFWPLLILALGWLGALLYWSAAARHSYSRTPAQ